MSNPTILKIIVAVIFVWMTYIVYETSAASNLFTEWNSLSAIPWMKATLWDFYANVFFIYLWILYKESNWSMKVVWLILLVCLGSIATAGYVLIQLFKLKSGEPVTNIILNKNKTIF
jgi:hypothetical protein